MFCDDWMMMARQLHESPDVCDCVGNVDRPLCYGLIWI